MIVFRRDDLVACLQVETLGEQRQPRPCAVRQHEIAGVRAEKLAGRHQRLPYE